MKEIICYLVLYRVLFFHTLIERAEYCTMFVFIIFYLFIKYLIYYTPRLAYYIGTEVTLGEPYFARYTPTFYFHK